MQELEQDSIAVAAKSKHEPAIELIKDVFACVRASNVLHTALDRAGSSWCVKRVCTCVVNVLLLTTATSACGETIGAAASGPHK